MAKTIELKKIKFFGQDYKNIEKLYKKAFPEYERINFPFLAFRSLTAEIELLAIYAGDEFIGFSYLISKNNLSLLLYFAIKAGLQGQGYGSKVLAEIKEYKKNNRLILEIEAPKKESSNYQQRVRRKDFYLKNDFKFSGLISKEETEEFEILTLRGEKFAVQEYLAILKKLFTPLFFKFHTPQVYSQAKNSCQ